jgi:hypothetical protein
MKRYRYTLCQPDGRIESLCVPSIFSPHELAHRLPGTLVFLYVPGSASAATKTGFVSGPAFVFVDSEDLYQVPQVPLVDAEAALSAWAHRAGAEEGSAP